MKSTLTYFIAAILLLSFNKDSLAQNTISPDKFIDKLLKDDYSMAIRVPGWAVRTTGKLASYDLEGDEKKIVRELSKSVKRARVLVNTNLPNKYDEELSALYNYFGDNNYDEYMQVRSEGNNITLWAQQKGENIKNIVLVVMNNEDDSAVINLKTDLDIDRLKRMNFFKEMQKI
jgi:Lhr-like helicase